MAAGGGTKAVIAAFLANLGIALAKGLGFVITRSTSMMAESIHSFADAGNQLLLLFGGRRALRPATPEHPFGYGRARYFWSFVVAIVLFLLGGLFSLYEGIEKLRHPHELESLGWAIGILIFGIVLEALSFRTAIREARPHKGDANWWQFIRRSKNPELPVVLLEDLGAQVGLVIALFAVCMAEITGNHRWDGVGSTSIGVLLCIIAVVLAVEMKGLLIGESASAAHQQQLEAAIAGTPRVRGLIHMRTQHLGPEELLVAAKVEFDHDLSVPDLARAVDELEARLRESIPIARVIYIEPDVRRAAAKTAAPTTAAER